MRSPDCYWPSYNSFYKFSIFRNWLRTLSSRLSTAKLITMYKVHNNVSQYLKEAMHCKVNNMSTHNIRNRENYTLPEYRLEVYKT